MKLSLCFIKNEALKTCRGSGGIAPRFNLILDEGEWLHICPGRFTPGRNSPQYRLVQFRPQSRSVPIWTKSCSNSDFQTVASCALRVPSFCI